jgi:hypothetical protein
MNRAIEIGNRELGQLKERIKKLQKWLDDEKENAPLTLADVLSEMLNGHDRSHWQQIRDLKMAAKTLVFIQENKLTTIEDIRGKVSEFYGEQQAINAEMKPVDRRLKTLNEHLHHSVNFTKYRKTAEKRAALYAEYKQLDSQGLFFKLKVKKALETAEDFDRKHYNAIHDYYDAEKYLRDVLQKRFDPKKIPVDKWRKEYETLTVEKNKLIGQYGVLKERIREVELIRKYAEEVQRVMSPPQKKRVKGLDI